MDIDNVRKGITQAKLYQDILGIFSFQLMVTSIGTGIYFKSWAVFGLLFILPIFIYKFSGRYKVLKKLTIILSILYIVIWAIGGYILGNSFGSLSASLVLAIIGLLAGIGCNKGMFLYFKDLQ